MKLKWRFVFAWYDLWVGLYYNRAKRRLYCISRTSEAAESLIAGLFPRESVLHAFARCGDLRILVRP